MRLIISIVTVRKHVICQTEVGKELILAKFSLLDKVIAYGKCFGYYFCIIIMLIGILCSLYVVIRITIISALIRIQGITNC